MTEELNLFLEDMDEQLSIMESTLLDISDIPLNEISKEMINNIFRAMHTMKGNAGMFGYDVIIEFAHIAESLLDEIRNDRIKFTQEILELMLLVKDHSKLLVEVYTNEKELNKKEKEHHDFLLKKLNGFFGSSNENEENIITNETKENEQEIENESDSGLSAYKIVVTLKEDFFKTGMDIFTIIRYLLLHR